MHSRKIAWIQGYWAGNAENTLRFYETEARSLRGSGVDLLVLPELFHTPYFPVEEHPAHFDLAIPLNHNLVETWRQIAREIACVIVLPVFERRAPGIYQNSVLVLERDGNIAAVYRKNHIPDDPGFYEKYYFMPGDNDFTAVHTSAGTLGVLICWDQWFPEPARILSLQGAEILVYPTAIGWDDRESPDLYPKQLEAWQVCMRAHAIANGVFVLAVNRTGQEHNLRFWGNSFLCKPDGSLQYSCDAQTNATHQQVIQPGEIDLQRRAWPFMRDRRVDQYHRILEKWCTP